MAIVRRKNADESENGFGPGPFGCTVEQLPDASSQFWKDCQDCQDWLY
jgi:hypothetical protein